MIPSKINSPLQFLHKVVSVRRALMRTGKSCRDAVEMEQSIEPIERWLKFWKGKATDEGALVMIRKHEMKIRDIIPGGASGCAPALRTQLEELLTNNVTI